MLLRSLALRDEAMALCDPAVDMLLWKLAPINDISTFGSLVILLRQLRRAQAAMPSRVLQPSSGLDTTKGPSQ